MEKLIVSRTILIVHHLVELLLLSVLCGFDKMTAGLTETKIASVSCPRAIEFLENSFATKLICMP